MKKSLSIILTIVLLMAAMTGTAFASKDDAQGFSDIQGHWGLGSIMKMQSLGILDGYEDGTFRPDSPLTPEELAVILDRILDKRLGLDPDADIESEDDEDEDEDVADVPGWAKKSVSRGFAFKYLDMNRFHSQVQVSRLGVAAALAKALDLEPVEDFDSNPFKDMDLSDEDYGYLIALYDAGILKGYPDGNFNPNGIINRGQMASIISGIFDEDDEEEEELNDQEEPTWASGASITLEVLTTSSVAITWPDATDDEGIVSYKVYQNNVLIATLDDDENEYEITGLVAGHGYIFKVRAVDTDGNFSDSLRKNYTTLL